VLGVVLSLVVITQMASLIILVGSGVVVLGIVWYAAYARTRAVSEGLLREAIRRPPARPHRVVVPVANPAAQHGLLEVAAASARVADETDGGDSGQPPELLAVNVVEGDPEDPLRNVEADRLTQQQELLAEAHEIAATMDADVQTRAVVAPDVPTAIRDVLAEEAPEQLLLGWDGQIGADGDGSVFGEMIDHILGGTDREVSLVSLSTDPGRTVGMISPDSDDATATAVARRARAIATIDGGRPTLATVVTDATDGAAARERGRDRLEAVAAAAGLAADAYEPVVVVATDVDAAVRELLPEYETVCVGLPATDASPPRPGPITELVARTYEGNVVVVRPAVGG
jgi:hypothetical protein